MLIVYHIFILNSKSAKRLTFASLPRIILLAVQDADVALVGRYDAARDLHGRTLAHL